MVWVSGYCSTTNNSLKLIEAQNNSYLFSRTIVEFQVSTLITKLCKSAMLATLKTHKTPSKNCQEVLGRCAVIIWVCIQSVQQMMCVFTLNSPFTKNMLALGQFINFEIQNP